MENSSDLEENIMLQKEEIEALTVIFGNDYAIEAEDNKNFKITLVDSTKLKSVQLDVTFQPEYPLFGPPLYAISAPWLSREQKYQLCRELENIYSDHFGESVLFMWIEKIRELIETDGKESFLLKMTEDLSIVANADVPDSSRPVNSNSIQDSKAVPEEEISIQHGLPLTDRRSTFQAHIATVRTVEEVKEVNKTLLKNKKIASATHNISAYRIYLEPKKTFLQDCDDDGETHAGSRLLHLLQILDVRNVLVVVSRWYGGIQLGPDRFKHINNVARSLLKDAGCIPEQKATTENTSNSSKSKKKRPK